MSTKCVINVDLADIWGETGRKKFLRTLAWGDEVAVTKQDSTRIEIETSTSTNRLMAVFSQ